MRKLFGTDGIRGTANADLSAELALQVGRAIGLACREGVLGRRSARPWIVVGRDTRVSGPMLQGALVAGLCSAGADAVEVGVIPTPGVAFLTADLDADAGVVLSASHNPVEDNGIKVFSPGGWKLDEGAEEAISSLVGAAAELPTGPAVGRSHTDAMAGSRYLDHLAGSISRSVEGRDVVVDCAHGAASGFAPEALRRAGAEVHVVHGTPEGERINVDCGATYPEVVAKFAAEREAVGLTLDGDADRVLAADESGRVVDGDQIIALLARILLAEQRLPDDAVVVTVMANQALREWARGQGITLHETPVGDRNVLARMRATGANLGGEQSGHVIVADRTTTGDGILTGLLLLEAVVATGARLADVLPFEPFPQVLLNVRTPQRERLSEAARVWDAVASAEARLGNDGRVLIRPSGTEPLVRVMVEARTSGEASEVASELARVVEEELA